MRLYLNAESKNHVGYTPDWLKVCYKEKEEDFELTLDIRGEIDYDNDCLCCRCKGYLDPWVLYNQTTGDEIELSELPEEEVEKMFPLKRIAEILKIGTDFRIGIYPANDSEENFKLAQEDSLSNCSGKCEIYDGDSDTYTDVCFTFEAELNE